MKQKLTALMIALLLCLSACGETGAPTPAPTQTPAPTPAPTVAPTTPPTETPEEGTNILIAYFTWADNAEIEDEEAAIESALRHYDSVGDAAAGADAVSSASILQPGNAARLAEWIAEETGGDLHSIAVEEPYPGNYDDCLDRAYEERADEARPALSSRVENMEDYDIVFLGFPNWWYGLPMPVLSFVEEYDFSGKTVVPFVTHGTGGLSGTIRELSAALPVDAQLLEAIGVYRGNVTTAQETVREWLRTLGLVFENNSTEEENTMRIIAENNGLSITFELSDSQAARDLVSQLPLSVEIENYSTNEKIFYPPQSLDTSDAPAAAGGAGVLAYYAPWGDVAMFYGSFNPNSSLFELGRAVEGAENIPALTGTVELSLAE